MTTEEEEFWATAEEVYATRTKEEEMVQALLKYWQKGAHGYILEVKEDIVIQLGCENVPGGTVGYPAQPGLTWKNHRLPSPTRINLFLCLSFRPWVSKG